MRNADLTYLLIIPSPPPFWAILRRVLGEDRTRSAKGNWLGVLGGRGEGVGEALGGRGEEARGSEEARG